MDKLPRIKPKRIVRVLERLGFYIHHQAGSHVQLRHAVYPDVRVTVPVHTSFDLPPSILLSILKQARVSREDFLRNM